MAAAISLCSSLTPHLSHAQTATPILSSNSKFNLSFLSSNLSSLSLNSRKPLTFSSLIPKSIDAQAESISVIDTEIDNIVEIAQPKPEEVFAVVMVGGRQYIVFPGRYIYTQRLKDAAVDDKCK